MRLRYLNLLVIVALVIYCFWLRAVDRHNDRFVADLTDQVGELVQQRTAMEYHLSQYFAKEGYVLVFDTKGGFTVSRRVK